MMIDNLNRIGQILHRNQPSILTAAGITGTITTAYLAAKAGWHAGETVVRSEESDTPFELLNSKEREERIKDRVKLVWPFFIPPVISGATTIAAIGLGHKSHASRTAAAVSAYTVTERAFANYRERVTEQIGGHKEQVLRDELASRQMDEHPPPSSEIVIMGNGSVLCCELYTNRYFNCDMESLRKANNDINSLILNDLYVSLDTFYDIIGLPHTAVSSELGWTDGKQMELEFSSTITEDNRPCITFNYSYVQPI